MKRTLLLLAFVGLSTFTFADNRNPASEAVRFAMDSRQSHNVDSDVSVQYAPTSNGKGGIAVTGHRDTSVTSIALMKSGSSCNGSSCSSCASR